MIIDPKAKTFLTLVNLGSYTKAAEELFLTQPAVSHQIRQLEKEYGIKIFYKNKKELKLTPEGAVLLKYTKRAMAIHNNAKQAIEDCRKRVKHLTVAITPTAGENMIPQMMARYCNQNPDIHINIFTDTINNIYDRMRSYEVDVAFIEGNFPEANFCSVLLDTDYLCLIVSPEHRFASRSSVFLEELKDENFILRPKSAGTRRLFENHLQSKGETIKNFNIMIELDNVATIKELVCANLGISVIAHSACREEELKKKLCVVPINGASMVREINMVYHRDFSHTEILDELRAIYHSID